MPTPTQLAAARAGVLTDDFVVNEVIECVDEGEEGHGNEDLEEKKASSQKRITQDAFDEAVREYIEDLEMDEDAAFAEARETFKLQGVCLDGLQIHPSRTRGSMTS